MSERGPNPKDLYGVKKVSLSKIPGVAKLHCALAMMDGAVKYDPYNWRNNSVLATIYIDAAMRHLQAWLDGEEYAPDSRVHHLGHVMACCAIVLDAQEGGNLIDDRPHKGKFAEVAARLADLLKKGEVLSKESLLKGKADDKTK